MEIVCKGNLMRRTWQISMVTGLVTLLFVISFCDLFKNKSTTNGSGLPEPVDPGPIGTIATKTVLDSLKYWNIRPLVPPAVNRRENGEGIKWDNQAARLIMAEGDGCPEANTRSRHIKII